MGLLVSQTIFYVNCMSSESWCTTSKNEHEIKIWWNLKTALHMAQLIIPNLLIFLA